MKRARGLSVLLAAVMLVGVRPVPAMEHPMIDEEATRTYAERSKFTFPVLLDSANFDAKLVQLEERLDELLAEE